jgi:hypothetical protein
MPVQGRLLHAQALGKFSRGPLVESDLIEQDEGGSNDIWAFEAHVTIHLCLDAYHR